MANTYKQTHDEYMASVGAKINAAQDDIRKSGNRDVTGFQFSAERIRKGAENLFFSQGSKAFEPVGSFFTAFAERPGISNVDNVQGVDIVDINIAATQQSILGYLAAERGMDKPTDTLWFQTLNAKNAIGGYNAGDTVFSPFAPVNKNIQTALRNNVEAAGTSATTTTFAGPLAKGSVVVTVTNASDQVIATGTDNGNGQILISDPAVVTTATTVDYAAGKVTMGTVASGTIKITARLDKTAESAGTNTLKVQPKPTTINITAEPRRIQLEQSYEDAAYMNKQAFNLSQAGVQTDYAKIAVNQLLDTFVRFLDFDVATQTAVVAFEAAAVDQLDMTNYILTTSQANTKNDIVNQYVLKLNKSLQQKSGKGMTALLVDSEGALLLGNNPMYFVANPTFDSDLDGYVGMYRGTPVVRHHVLDGVHDTMSEVHATIIAVHKDASGVAGPVVYGEYLSPYSVVPALNFDNPAQYAQGLYSMSNTVACIKDYAAWLDVIVSK
jgi:hypothetical protein